MARLLGEEIEETSDSYRRAAKRADDEGLPQVAEALRGIAQTHHQRETENRIPLFVAITMIVAAFLLSFVDLRN